MLPPQSTAQETFCESISLLCQLNVAQVSTAFFIWVTHDLAISTADSVASVPGDRSPRKCILIGDKTAHIAPMSAVGNVGLVLPNSGSLVMAQQITMIGILHLVKFDLLPCQDKKRVGGYWDALRVSLFILDCAILAHTWYMHTF